MDTLLKKSVYLPSAILQPYIDRYWIGEGASAACSEPVFAIGTGAEMIFQLKAPITVATNGDTGRRLPLNAIYCIRNHVYRTAINHSHKFIAVRFKAGAIRHFSPMPVAALADAFPDVTILYRDWGKRLVESLHVAITIPRQIALIEDFLVAMLRQYHNPHALVDESVRQLYYSRERIEISSLSANLGSSYRQFERLFVSKVGVTPKSFQQTARLHRTLKYLLFNNCRDYLPVAFDFGYYDQSHFIRACRRFFGDKPTAVFPLERTGQHFYMPPLQPLQVLPAI